MSSGDHGASRRPALPEKKYFKIGEVAELVGVEPHVLRYWETQFPQLRPHKARSGHRLYRRREVETLLAIRELLHVQRFTIAGARQALRQPGGASSLLPRFFELPADGADNPTLTGAEGDGLPDGDGDGLPDIDAELDADLTDPDGVALSSGSSRAGDTSVPDGAALQSVEALGLEPEALRAAMAREQAERSARRGVAEVELVAEPTEELPTRRPLAARGALSMGPARRALIEGALADARTILALLDREDRRDQRALI